MNRPTLEAVCFDYWNTLVHEDGRMAALRREAWTARIGGTGRALADHEFDVAFEGAWTRFTDAWRANRQYLVADAARDLLAELAVPDPSGSLEAALVDDLHEVARGAELELTPGVAACLQRLKDAGLRLGIICDVGMTPSPLLRHHLERHGVLHLFDHWSFSDEVGWYKPAAAMFQHALDGLGGVAPARAAHVGDLRRTDVAGAQAMGLVAVRYRGIFDDVSDGPEADLVYDHHDDLHRLLNVG